MREYKYRGKGIADNEWYFGDLIQTRLGTTWIITEDYTTATEEISLNTCASPQVKAETVGQYTGLHDKNGKEIYEGDIIEFSYDMFVGNFDTFVAKGKIIFEEGAFYVEVFENERTTEGEAYLLYSINLDTIKVIGNIYENKELLNETNR